MGVGVFTGELENILRSPRQQVAPFVIGSVVGLAATVSLISARVVPFLLMGVTLAWLVCRLWRHGIRAALPPLDRLTAALGLFLLYVLASSLWAVAPSESIPKIAMAAGVALGTFALAQLSTLEPRAGILRAAEGLWFGFFLGLVYFLIECLTNQALKIWVFNAIHIDPSLLQPERAFRWKNGRLMRINYDTLTRNAAPISLLLWPALLAALGAIKRPWNTWVAATLLVLAVWVGFLSPHETTKVALVAGIVAYAWTRWSPVWGHRALQAGWLAACLAVLPAAILAHKLDLHNAPWLQRTAQHRIIIWNFTALHALEQPIFGRGANMTYVLGPEMSKSPIQEPGEHFERKMSRHAHNLFLQNWFELGAVGALLLSAFGLAILWRLSALDGGVRPFAYANFASAAAIAGSSYGMWQAWFLCLFGLSAGLFAIGARAFETSGRPAPFAPGTDADTR